MEMMTAIGRPALAALKRGLLFALVSIAGLPGLASADSWMAARAYDRASDNGRFVARVEPAVERARRPAAVTVLRAAGPDARPDVKPRGAADAGRETTRRHPRPPGRRCGRSR